MRVRHEYEIELNMTCPEIEDLIIELAEIQREMRKRKEKLFGYTVMGASTETETLVIQTFSYKKVDT